MTTMPATASCRLVAPADGGEYYSVGTTLLRVGIKLKAPIYDLRNVLLLSEGQVVSPSFLRNLENRGVANVKVHESELTRLQAFQPLGTATVVPDEPRGHLAPLRTAASERLDRATCRSECLGLPPQGPAFIHDLQQHGATAYDEERREKFIRDHSQAVNQMEEVFQELSRGKGLDLHEVNAVVDEAMTNLAEDPDLFAGLGINPFSNKYPARHSLHTTMLALSIGTQLGLDRLTLRELSIGCLVHDAGMLRLDRELYGSVKRIDPVGFLEVTKHPIYVFDMLKDASNIPSRSAFIAYQIHERCNGKGYPRRREGNQIHFLSKVAAVADVYVGLVSPRPHRPGLMPYLAVERLLQGVKSGLFDRTAVRALLTTISLFPIGSYVELSDGRVGRVLRANGPKYDRPVLEVWEPRSLHLPPHIVDLSECDETLHVVKALPMLQPAAESHAAIDHWI